DETRRVERWLATARVFLATSALVATWLDPTELTSNSTVPWWLLRLYIAHSVVVMLLVRWRRESTPAFRVLVHAADILCPAPLSPRVRLRRCGPFFFFACFLLFWRQRPAGDSGKPSEQRGGQSPCFGQKA